jgi:hypothetical protein
MSVFMVPELSADSSFRQKQVSTSVVRLQQCAFRCTPGGILKTQWSSLILAQLRLSRSFARVCFFAEAAPNQKFCPESPQNFSDL